MVDKAIGVGIIGANPDRGWALDAHIPAIRALSQFRLAAVSTSRPETAAEAGRKFGVPAFADAEALARCPDVDLVVVAVKVPQHRELVMAGLRAGKNVYCEWPLGNGTAEARELADFAERQNVRGFVGLQGRFNPVVQQVMQMLRDGYAGEVLSTTIVGSGAAWGPITASAGAYLSDTRNGATMLSIPIGHTLDAVCQALGEFAPSSAISAIRRRRVLVADTGETIEPDAPDQIGVLGTFGDATPAAVHYRGGIVRGTNLLWEINGSEGDLVVTAATGHLQMSATELQGARGTDRLEPIAIEPAHRWAPSEVPEGPPLNVAQAYLKVAEALAGNETAAPTFRDAVRRHEMLDAIQAVMKPL